MLDSLSQLNLLTDCAKDWGFNSDNITTSLQAELNTCLDFEELEVTWHNDEIEESSVNLVHYANLSSQEATTLIHDLIKNPKTANIWQLCLMGSSKESMDSLTESLYNPFEGIEAWLMEGIRKGWLRKFQEQYNLPLIEYPLFAHRLEQDCLKPGSVFTVVNIKINANDIQKILLLQSLAKYLTNDDYLCEINGLGYALVLSGRKNFAASAVMEKIADTFERKLHTHYMDVNFSIGMVEFSHGDTVETLLDHAKEALHMPSPIGIKVKSYTNHSKQKNAENNSLVQSNEKRFLFFGV